MSRTSISSFRRDALGGYVDAFLVPAEDVAKNTPLMQNAVRHYRLMARNRTCFSCGGQFGANLQAGAYLLTVPERAQTSCGTSAICTECWGGELSDAAIERAALKVIRKILPGAKFEVRLDGEGTGR
jgi:hypothetical protein